VTVVGVEVGAGRLTVTVALRPGVAAVNVTWAAQCCRSFGAPLPGQPTAADHAFCSAVVGACGSSSSGRTSKSKPLAEYALAIAARAACARR
jgi:hypothetical protein